MFYTLLTIACLCNVAEIKQNTVEPSIKVQPIIIEKFINTPKKFKVSKKVKYNKVPTRWERSWN